MEKAYRIGERILDEHALGVASDEVFGGRALVVGEQDGGLIVAEVGDVKLAVGALKRTRLLFVEAWVAVFAMGYVEFDGAPGRRRQVGDFGEQLGRAAAQGEEGDAGGIETVEPRVGGELGGENQGS